MRKKIKGIYILCLSSVLVACLSKNVIPQYGLYDGRSLTSFERDERITHSIHRQLMRAAFFKEAHIVVHSFNQEVLLTGEATKASISVFAEKLALSTYGVKHVYNEIILTNPASTWIKGRDAWITGYVRSQLMAEKALSSSAIHVVTENGNVYLLGLVTRQQASIAVNVARHVRGVSRVVKVFEYVR
jgi:osmotically-inducible protein OsmY